ncbi:zinc finger protein 2-like [Mya arenaria]|uniref:zinc finger protein 2-like n=2 Tax=Mya arenaria TaxID=6604 RepID=UPI0022E12392|nr:zinc finger protein 2-like [Mya arenaria]
MSSKGHFLTVSEIAEGSKLTSVLTEFQLQVLSLEELAGRIADIDKRRAREILENAVQRIIELLTVEKPFAVSEKASIGQIDSTVELANENTETDSPIILVNELETSESTASNQEDIVAWEEPLTQDQDKIVSVHPEQNSAAISDVAFSTTPNLRTAKPHGLVFTMVTRGSKQPKQKTGNQSDENMEPTILGPVRKRGRGRPKGTIPPPVVNDQGQNVYRCETCKAEVKTYHALLVHMRRHSGQRPFTCDICGKAFTTKGNMQAHVACAHTDEKPWTCPTCGKAFKEKKSLKIHERIHTGEKPYSCSECHQAFTQLGALKEHMLIHAGLKPHLCDLCGQEFRSRTNLNEHKKRHLTQKLLQCRSCDNTFYNRASLQRHEAMHIKAEYSCDLCGDTFTQPDDLHNHLLTVHTTVAQPLVCENCNFVFEDQSEWAEHRQLHENDSGALGGTPVPVEGGDTVYLTSGEGLLTSGGGDQVLLVEEGVGIGGGGYDALHSVLVSAAMSADTLGEGGTQFVHVLCVDPETAQISNTDQTLI